MWVSESFRSLPLLLDFANDRRVRIERAQIVVAHDETGAEVFHLIFEPTKEPDLALTAVAVAEAEVAEPAEAEEVVDEAEAIIHDAQRDG